MESLPDLIIRLKKELNQARATRDRIEKVGLSSNFGGVSFAQVNYDLILKRIARLEADLFDAEQAQDGSSIRSDIREGRVSAL